MENRELGPLIRQERLRQNLSQEGLCRGICAPSYLSKIEQGQAAASDEVVDQLLAALGLRCCRDREVLARGETLLAEYWEGFVREEDLSAQTAALYELENQLLCSPLHLEFQVFLFLEDCRSGREEEAATRMKALRPLESGFSPRLAAWYNYGCYYCTEEAAYLEAAFRLWPTAWVCYYQASHLYYRGQYSAAVEKAQRACTMALEEGNLYLLVWSTFLLGSGYVSCGDMTLGEQYYRRAVSLSRGVDDHPRQMMWYNLGASWLERQDYDRALRCLVQVGELEEELTAFLLQQKLALVHAHFHQEREAASALHRAEELLGRLSLPPEKMALCRDMLDMAAFQLRPGFLDDPAYEGALSRLWRDADRLGFGFQRFFGVYLIALCQHQRRYKEALAISQAMNRELS